MLSYFIKDYTPGDVANMQVGTTPIAFTLMAGMKLHIDISSAAGDYVPHANVKSHFAYVTETRVAKTPFTPKEATLNYLMKNDDLGVNICLKILQKKPLIF